jgi:hypothetical protein
MTNAEERRSPNDECVSSGFGIGHSSFAAAEEPFLKGRR